MSLKLKNETLLSLPLRLTLWYACIFAISSLIAFTIIYFIIASILEYRTDDDLTEDVTELSVLLAENGIAGLNAEFQREVLADGKNAVFYRLFDNNSNLLITTDTSGWAGLKSGIEISQLSISKDAPLFETMPAPNDEYDARVVYGVIHGGNIIQIGESLEENDEFLEVFRNVFAITLPVLIFIAAFLGWFMAKRALRGVDEMTEAALDISRGELNRRVPEPGSGDEIDRLAKTFNSMLDRIQILITSMREMTDNIAHDLRSPLARIRGIAESSITSHQSVDDYRSVAANTVEECDRLLHMINTMLDITETEAGAASLAMTPVNITSVIGDACELFQPLAEDKEITLKCDTREQITIEGHLQYLQRLVANLLDNALKYTDKAGKVWISIHRQADNAVITAKDTGIGIAADDLPNIFKRFYRCDQSRTENGSGLGLSLAIAIARVHGGNITVESTPDQGSNFIVTLPIT